MQMSAWCFTLISTCSSMLRSFVSVVDILVDQGRESKVEERLENSVVERFSHCFSLVLGSSWRSIVHGSFMFMFCAQGAKARVAGEGFDEGRATRRRLTKGERAARTRSEKTKATGLIAAMPTTKKSTTTCVAYTFHLLRLLCRLLFIFVAGFSFASFEPCRKSGEFPLPCLPSSVPIHGSTMRRMPLAWCVRAHSSWCISECLMGSLIKGKFIFQDTPVLISCKSVHAWF